MLIRKSYLVYICNVNFFCCDWITSEKVYQHNVAVVIGQNGKILQR